MTENQKAYGHKLYNAQLVCAKQPRPEAFGITQEQAKEVRAALKAWRERGRKGPAFETVENS